MDQSDIDKLSAEATKTLLMKALAIIGRKLDHEDEITAKDALAVVDSCTKRLGLI